MAGKKQNGRNAIETIARDIRRLFHLLKAVANALHADLGISASMRAVLESLALNGPSTVPQIARARPVTRQHIQMIVDELLKARLVELRPNPAHKRSALVALTPAGESAFATMRRREAVLLDQLAVNLDRADTAAAIRVLGRMKERLLALLARQSTSKGEDDDT